MAARIPTGAASAAAGVAALVALVQVAGTLAAQPAAHGQVLPPRGMVAGATTLDAALRTREVEAP